MKYDFVFCLVLFFKLMHVKCVCEACCAVKHVIFNCYQFINVVSVSGPFPVCALDFAFDEL